MASHLYRVRLHIIAVYWWQKPITQIQHGKSNIYIYRLQAFEYVKRAQLERYHKASEEEKASIELDPVVVFHKAIENGQPLLITTKVVKAGQTYQVGDFIFIFHHFCF